MHVAGAALNLEVLAVVLPLEVLAVVRMRLEVLAVLLLNLEALAVVPLQTLNLEVLAVVLPHTQEDEIDLALHDDTHLAVNELRLHHAIVRLLPLPPRRVPSL